MPFRSSPEGQDILALLGGPQVQDEDGGGDLFSGLLDENTLALINMLGLGIGGLTLETDPATGKLVPKLSFRPQDSAASGAQSARQFGLNKLTSALSGYLQGTQNVAGRRLGAFQQAANLLPGIVDPSQKFFSGLEPGGTLQTVAQRAGIPFSPVEIQHQQLSPGELARTPELDPMAAALIQQIQGA